MKVAILGGSGQVASCMALTRPQGTIVHNTGYLAQESLPQAPDPAPVTELVLLSHADADITDPDSLARCSALTSADVIVNAAAYTAVDRAESPDQRALAFTVNAEGPGHIAELAAKTGAHLIHISTDYVFSGQPAGGPLLPDAPADPATVYGQSKLAGEQAVQSWAARGAHAVIVRTAWVFSGATLPAHQDFVSTMIRLEQTRDTVRVVDDQFGNPTYAPDLAQGIWRLAGALQDPDTHAVLAPGAVLHATGTGYTTWYEVAREVFRARGADPDRVEPCSSAEYPTAARRPQWSVLANDSWLAAGLEPLPEWRDAVWRGVEGKI